MTWNEVIEALGQEKEEEFEELDFIQKHKKYPAIIQSPIFLSKIAQEAYEDGKKDGYVKAKVEQIQPLEPYYTILKIRAEIESIDLAKNTKGDIKRMALDIVDKYAAESEN